MASLLWNRLCDKRGQIRGIDFTISAFFFVIVLGQLVVVILNANIMVISQNETNTSRSDIDRLAEAMFGSEGSPTDWGDLSSGQPTSFGLAIEEMASTGFELDPRKLARLNVESARITGYDDVAISYESIHELMGLGVSTQFYLRIRSALSLDLDPGDHEVSVRVAFLGLEKISGAQVSLFAVNLTDGVPYFLTRGTTDINGEVLLDYSGYGSLDFPHALIVVGQKGPMWGVNHFIPDEDVNPLSDISSSDSPLFLTQLEAFSGSGAGRSDFRSSTQNHTFSFLYTNFSSMSGFSHSIQKDHTTGAVLDIAFDASAEGVIIGIVCVRESNGAFNYRLGTLPALMDKSEETIGIFPAIGPAIPDTGTAAVGSNSYFLTVRGTLLVAELSIWKET